MLSQHQEDTSNGRSLNDPNLFFGDLSDSLNLLNSKQVLFRSEKNSNALGPVCIKHQRQFVLMLRWCLQHSSYWLRWTSLRMELQPILKGLHCDNENCVASVIAELTLNDSDTWRKWALSDEGTVAGVKRHGSMVWIFFVRIVVGDGIGQCECTLTINTFTSFTLYIYTNIMLKFARRTGCDNSEFILMWNTSSELFVK